MAERGLFIAVSRLLWGFNIERGRDTNGDVLPIDPDAVSDGFIVRPKPFESVSLPLILIVVIW